MNHLESNKKKAVVGFSVVHHPLEVGSDKSFEILEKASSLFPKSHINLIKFEKIIDCDKHAKEAGLFFKSNDVDIIVVIQSTWSNDYLVVDLLEYISVPVILWAIPGIENGSLCGIHQLGVVLYEIGKRYMIVNGKIEKRFIEDNIIPYANAAALKNYLRKIKLGLVGYRIPGMTEVSFDEIELKKKFGPRVVHLNITDIKKIYEKIDESESIKIWNEIKNTIKDIRVSDSDGIDACRYYLTYKTIARNEGLAGFAVECYPEFMGQVCLASSILLEKDDIIISCEGDINSGVGMLILNYLTRQPVHNTDLLNADSDYSVLFSHCGSGAFSIAKNQSCISLCPVRIKGKGVSVIFLPKLGDITLVNIVGRKNTYRLSAIEAYSQETKMIFPGNPVSARFNITSREYLETIAQNAIGHHWIIGYGKVIKELKFFSKLIDINFIDFNN